MPPALIDAAEWDAGPVRELLVWSLAGPVLVWGFLPEFERAQRLGLLDLRPAHLEELRVARSQWVSGVPHFAKLTVVGRVLALRLAHSWELTRLLEVYAFTSQWRGEDPFLFVSELDLRAGGTGQLREAPFLSSHEEASRLPRRGLDG